MLSRNQIKISSDFSSEFLRWGPICRNKISRGPICRQGAQSAGARFAGAQFAGAQFAGAQFATNKFSGAQFAAPKIFWGPICRGPHLPGPNLPGPNLPGPNLPGPNLPQKSLGAQFARGPICLEPHYTHFCQIFGSVDLRVLLPRPAPRIFVLAPARPAPPRWKKLRPAHPWISSF